MADSSIKEEFLNSAIVQLYTILNSSKQQRRYYEKSSNNLCKVLKPCTFRPSRTGNSNETTKNEEQTPKSEAETPIPEKEVAELQIVDDMISKAEKLRNRIHTKLLKEGERVETECVKQPLISSNRIFKQSDDVQKDPALRTQQENEVTRSEKSALNSDTGTISQGKLDNLLKSTNVSVKRKSHSTHQVKAPFHTNTVIKKSSSRNLPVTKITSTKSRQTSASRPTGANTFDSKIVQSNRQAKLPSKLVMVKQKSLSQAENRVQDPTKCERPVSSNIPGIEAPVEREKCQNVAKPSISSEGIGDAPSNKNDTIVQSNSTENKEFLLAKDGKNIEIPGKMKKLILNNFRLRMKVKHWDLHKKVTKGPSIKEQFLNSISEHNKNQMTKSNYELWEQMSILCTLYDNLLLKIEDAAKKAIGLEKEPIAKLGSVRQEFVYVLEQFAELQNSFIHLQKASDDCVEKACHSETKKMQEKHSEKHSAAFWVPYHLRSNMPKLSHCLRYKSKKDLLRYHRLLHEIQLLHLKLHLMEVSKLELLSCLQHTPQNSKDFHLLYTNVFSLLCTNGTVFPSLVKDMEEEESLVTDELDF